MAPAPADLMPLARTWKGTVLVVKHTGEFDAVVVGAGPNGLVGAVMLAEAGLKVLLAEGADEFGGGLRSGPLTGLDGFTHDWCATVLPMIKASAAFRDLDLGVELLYPAVQAAHPLDGQDAVLIHRDVAQTAAGLGVRRDALAWRQSVGAAARGGLRGRGCVLEGTGLCHLRRPPPA